MIFRFYFMLSVSGHCFYPYYQMRSRPCYLINGCFGLEGVIREIFEKGGGSGGGAVLLRTSETLSDGIHYGILRIITPLSNGSNPPQISVTFIGDSIDVQKLCPVLFLVDLKCACQLSRGRSAVHSIIKVPFSTSLMTAFSIKLTERHEPVMQCRGVASLSSTQFRGSSSGCFRCRVSQPKRAACS